MVFNESIEAHREADKKNQEYEQKNKKYENNPNLAKKEKEKANEIFTSKKSPEELKKYKQILDEVKILERDENNLGKTQDQIFEIAEKIVEEKQNIKGIENVKTIKEIPESTKKIVKETTGTVKNILENSRNSPEYNQEKEIEINANYEAIGEEKINNPKYSVLERLMKSGELTAETNELVEININTKGKINEEFKKSIENKDDLRKIQEILKLIPDNKEAIPTDNLINFKEDFPDLSDIAINGIEAKSIKKGENPSNYEILAYEKIAENYIKIGTTSEDKEKNYSTAIKTASANLLKNNKLINRDKIQFKEAINNIHQKNSKEQFEGLAKIIELKEKSSTDNAAKGNALEKKGKNKTREKLEGKFKKLKSEYLELKEINNEESKKRMVEIQKEGKKIQELLKEKPKSGEVMGGGKNETINSNIEKTKQ